MRILAISGSLRADSLNTKLLRAAAKLVERNTELQLWNGLKAIPPYDADDEPPAPIAVARLRATVTAADAVLFATPEYNGSIPGQLKNAIDWLSRPVATNPLRNMPVAVIGASAGIFGAVWAQAELKKVLALLGARVLDTELPIPHATTRFDTHGKLTDPETRQSLSSIVNQLIETAEQRNTTPEQRQTTA